MKSQVTSLLRIGISRSRIIRSLPRTGFPRADIVQHYYQISVLVEYPVDYASRNEG